MSDVGLEDVLNYNDPWSNPWRYNVINGEGVLINGASGNLEVLTNTPGYYYATGFDLSFLGVNQEFIAHFTMGCGNDNLMGRGSVPEPSTMFLIGTGFFGLAAVSRKKLFKK